MKMAAAQRKVWASRRRAAKAKGDTRTRGERAVAKAPKPRKSPRPRHVLRIYYASDGGMVRARMVVRSWGEMLDHILELEKGALLQGEGNVIQEVYIEANT
jgi:hypothetical protein